MSKNQMKNSNLPKAFLLLFLASWLHSCEAIAEIFTAGMGFGIFIAIAVLIGIIVLVLRVRKK